MSARAWLLLGVAALVVGYLAFMFWRIDRDNRPPPRWPGDP